MSAKGPALPIDAGAAAAVLAPGGAVAGALGHYEHRPEQIEMLAAVAGAFNDDGILVVEAGTGVGKSLAYLVPAILWSRANQQRVIVSTHTINLQEQLVGKDAPLLVRRPGLECTVALVKGRGNYLCRRKAAQAEAQQAWLLEDELRQELRCVLDWARTTTEGSLADLEVPPRPEVWEQVVSEDDNCLRARCPFFGTCFFYSARRAAAKADLLVVNHHLLMADLAVRRESGEYDEAAVLPATTRLILDEAHHVDEVASRHFGARLSLPAISRALNRLHRERPPHRGVLPALSAALASGGSERTSALAEGAARWIDERLIPRRQSLGRDTAECFSELADEIERLLARPLGDAVEKLRVTPLLQEQPFWSAGVRVLTRLAGSLSQYADEIEDALERLETLGEGAGGQVLFLHTELAALSRRLAGYAAAMLAFTEDAGDMCRWIEASMGTRTGPSIVLCAVPVVVGPVLREALFDRFATVVLTSATLAVSGQFDHLRERLGLGGIAIPERVQALQVASPFEYARQAVLAIPSDVPAPTDPAFEEASHRFMAELVQITGGGTFLLFTSYAALDRAWEALEPALREARCVPLRQGGASRDWLLSQFRANPRSVLFATDSFWEGVDVRGDALRAVVIAKLPFAVPTEPIQQARYEAIAARGGDPFAEYSLPQAVLKLKQGFGRLIRSRNDRGAVVILDSRVVQRRYGRPFLDSLPPARRLIGGSSSVLQGLRRFFDAGAG